MSRARPLTAALQRSFLAIAVLALYASTGRAGGDSRLELPAAFGKPLPEGVPDLRAIQDHVKKIVDRVMPATVAVQIGQAQGSGVIVDSEGHILTAGHVAGEAGRTVQIVLSDGRKLKGITLGSDVAIDSGLVKITEDAEFPHVAMGRSADLHKGQWVIALGHPCGYQKGRPPVVRVGRVLAANDAMLRTDCTLVGGDSGGPLVDMHGRVVGIHSRIGGSITYNIHVPVSCYADAWDKLNAGEVWASPYDGLGNAPFASLLRTHPNFMQLFQEVASPTSRATVRIRDDDKDVALGVIVDADGLIITKAFDLKGTVTCRFADGREFDARKLVTHALHDLALLRIDARGLPCVQFGASKEAAVGAWVTSMGASGAPVAVGVVSVPTREVLVKGLPLAAAELAKIGYLGVGLEPAPRAGLRVTFVAPQSAAAKAGLKTGDVVLEVADRPVNDLEQFQTHMVHRRAGDQVAILIRRGDDELTVHATLQHRPASDNRGEQQNHMGSELSTRRSGYPTILTHDSVVRPADCGGPLVDLDGNVIGINICRAGRTETWAIPSEVVQSVLAGFRSDR